jgi:hypothetical protein
VTQRKCAVVDRSGTVEATVITPDAMLSTDDVNAADLLKGIPAWRSELAFTSLETYPTGTVETADRLKRVKMAAEASREMVFIDVFIGF